MIFETAAEEAFWQKLILAGYSVELADKLTLEYRDRCPLFPFVPDWGSDVEPKRD